jgi:hypothetical protein
MQAPYVVPLDTQKMLDNYSIAINRQPQEENWT